MRESTRWTGKYQFWSMFLVNLMGIGVAFVFLGAAFYALMTKYIFREILSVIFTVVYFGMVYSRAHKFATLDAKEYTKTKQSLLKGFMFGVMISLSFVLVWGIYKIIWMTAGENGILNSFWCWLYGMIYWLYTVPYYGIQGLSHGHMMWYSVLIMFINPVLASTLGYYAGMKGFRIMDCIGGFVYEKKDK